MTYPTPVCHVMMKMLDHPGANKHDKAHFVKVHSYARSIGLMEGLDADTQQTLEVAALVHDIACPLCREKYGKAPGEVNQELLHKALGDTPVITGRFADTLEPQFEKTKAELKGIAKNDDDVLSYIAFPQVAEEFFKKRTAKEENVKHYSIEEIKE